MNGEELTVAKTYAVTGATGHVGKVVVQKLKTQGHHVRPIARSAGVDINDAAALAGAFQGSDGAFLLIPPEYKTIDLRAWQNDIGAKLSQAVKTAKLRRVIFLSNLNAGYEDGTGTILGLHDMEERLNGLDIPELVHLRPTMFMETHLTAIRQIARSGAYGGVFKPHVAFPMIATKDVGEVAALDELIGKHAENWRFERLAAIDRAILRLAVHELRGGETPSKVVLNEAVEMAKKFSNEESGAFVNGVLDAVYKSLQGNKL